MSPALATELQARRESNKTTGPVPLAVTNGSHLTHQKKRNCENSVRGIHPSTDSFRSIR